MVFYLKGQTSALMPHIQQLALSCFESCLTEDRLVAVCLLGNYMQSFELSASQLKKLGEIEAFRGVCAQLLKELPQINHNTSFELEYLSPWILKGLANLLSQVSPAYHHCTRKSTIQEVFNFVYPSDRHVRQCGRMPGVVVQEAALECLLYLSTLTQAWTDISELFKRICTRSGTTSGGRQVLNLRPEGVVNTYLEFGLLVHTKQIALVTPLLGNWLSAESTEETRRSEERRVG